MASFLTIEMDIPNKVYVDEPHMPDLERHLRQMDHELCTYILQLQPEEKYFALKLSCENYIGSLKRNNPFEYQPYRVPNDRQEMWREIRGFWNHLDIQFPVAIVDLIQDGELSAIIKEHQCLIANFSGNTLELSHKEQIVLSDGHYLILKRKHNLTIEMLKNLQEYFVKLGVEESLFEGMTSSQGCVVLYFLISPASTKQLPFTLSPHFPELGSMGVLTIAVPDQWEVDITTRKITMNMAKVHYAFYMQ